MDDRRQRGPWLRPFSPESRAEAVVVYAIVAGLVCFWRLGATGVVSMEGMVAEGARQMVASGEWVVPHLWGELYTYKPALAYWLAAIPLELAGHHSELLLRLLFAAAGFVMGLVVLFLIGRVASPRVGLLAAIAATSGVLFLQKARMAEFDGALAAGVGIAVAAACCNLAVDRERWDVWLLGYLGLTAGFLAKGLPALVVFGPGLLAAAVPTRRWRRLFGWRHLSAALVFVVLTGGYLVAAYRSAGARAFEQPLMESSVRGFGWQWRQEGRFLPEGEELRLGEPEAEVAASPLRALARTLAKPALIWGAFLPWSVLLLLPIRRWAGERSRADGRLGRAAAGFVAAAAVAFMAMPTHEMRYYLPLAVPLGILCGLVAGGRRGAELDERRGPRLGAAALAAVFAGGAVASGVALYSSPPIPEVDRWLLALAGAAGLAAIVHLVRKPVRDRVALVLLVAALCALAVQVLAVEPYRASKRDLSEVAAALGRHLPAGEPVWVLGPSDAAGKHSSLWFYLDRPVRAFRPDAAPSDGSCILTREGQDELETSSPGFTFRELGRVEHVRFTYLAGSCSTSD